MYLISLVPFVGEGNAYHQQHQHTEKGYDRRRISTTTEEVPVPLLRGYDQGVRTDDGDADGDGVGPLRVLQGHLVLPLVRLHRLATHKGDEGWSRLE